MKCRILHESRARMRIKLLQGRMTLRQADFAEYYLKAVDGVTDVKVYDRTCDAVILYKDDHERKTRSRVIDALAEFSYENSTAIVPEHTGSNFCHAPLI